MADGRVFEYEGVGFRVKKAWVQGSFRVEQTAARGVVVRFEPSDATESQLHGMELSGAQVENFKVGTNGPDSFLKLEIKGKKKAPLFNFGTRKQAVDTVVSVLQMRQQSDLEMKSGNDDAQVGETSGDLQNPSGPVMNDNGYYRKYAPNNQELFEWDPAASKEENEMRRELLEVDDELAEVYKATVNYGILTVQDFWSARKERLEEEAATRNQPRGLSSGLTADVQVTSTNQNEMNYQLTTEVIKRIFLEFPTVHRLYLDKVKTNEELTEERFWELYMRSRYHLPNRNLTEEMKLSADVQEAIRLFGDFDDDGDVEKEKKVKFTLDNKGNHPKVTVDPNIDLLTTLNDNPRGTPGTLAGVGMADWAGFGVANRDPAEADRDKKIRLKLQKLGRSATKRDVETLQSKPVASDPLLSRYNKHGEMVLPDEDDPAFKDRVQKRIERVIRESQTSSDSSLLEGDDSGKRPRPVPFNFDLVNGFSAIGGATRDTAESKTSSSFSQPSTAEVTLKMFLANPLSRAFPSAEDASKMSNYILSSFNHAHLEKESVEALPDGQEFLRVHRACKEVRKRFWTNFQQVIEDRKHIPIVRALHKRIDICIEKIQTIISRINDFREYCLQKGNGQISLMLLQVRRELEKVLSTWNKYETLRKRKRTNKT